MYKTILVPLDGSKCAEAVLPHAKALAYSEGASILLLNVFGHRASAAQPVSEEEDNGKRYTSGVEAKLKSEGFKVSSIFGQGAAATSILKIAGQNSVDLIAMATHGREGIARMLSGSVSQRVVHDSKVPVMLICDTP